MHDPDVVLRAMLESGASGGAEPAVDRSRRVVVVAAKKTGGVPRLCCRWIGQLEAGRRVWPGAVASDIVIARRQHPKLSPLVLR
jgi:hypothetical protein